jgi:epoxyqueuosine reductase
MAYLARPEAVAKRGNLERILPGTHTVVVVGLNYHTLALPPALRDNPARGIVASYAWGDDYHDLLRPRLHQLAAALLAGSDQPAAYRAYVDTGPLLERDLAARAGLGFIGKNTHLIHPRLGSWLLLGELLIAAPPPWGIPLQSCSPALRGEVKGGNLGTCGRCTRCLDACPTGALVAPYLLDARRCISYLTIELKGAIPLELRPLIGNRIFGCDICQEICPWNRRFARPTAEATFQLQPEEIAPPLLDLLVLGEEEFRQRFRGRPIMRARRRGLLRNVAVALGNWGDPAAIPALARALHDSEPLVRGHAAWALGCILTDEARCALAGALSVETQEWIRAEIERALAGG